MSHNSAIPSAVRDVPVNDAVFDCFEQGRRMVTSFEQAHRNIFTDR